MSWGSVDLMGGRSGVVQVAYLVDDVAAAARSHSRSFGSGPFFVAEHIPLASVVHRGEPAMFDHSSAYGQWGAVMVELVSVHGATPPTLEQATGRTRGGVHHVARFVADLDAEAAFLERHGYGHVMLACTSSGQRFAFHDGGHLGHLLEIYEPTPGLLSFYGRVAAAAEGWDGTEPVRRA